MNNKLFHKILWRIVIPLLVAIPTAVILSLVTLALLEPLLKK